VKPGARDADTDPFLAAVALRPAWRARRPRGGPGPRVRHKDIATAAPSTKPAAMAHEPVSWPVLARHGGVLVGRAGARRRGGHAGCKWSGTSCAARDGRVASRDRQGGARQPSGRDVCFAAEAVGTRRAREVRRGGRRTGTGGRT